MKSNIYSLLRLLYGSIFIFSGVSKLYYRSEFVSALYSYNIIPTEITTYFAIFIIVVEIIIGLGIIVRLLDKFFLVFSIFLLLSFTIFAIYSVIFDKNWVCYCFGSWLFHKLNFITIIRNCIIIFLGLYLITFRKITIAKNPKFIFGKYSIILLTPLLLIGTIHLIKSQKNIKQVEPGAYIPISDFFQTNYYKMYDKKYKYVLLVAFDYSDCSSCLMETYLWKEIYEKYNKNILILGIGSAPNKLLLDQFIKDKQLNFTISYDQEKIFTKRYGIITPARMVLDRNNKLISIERSSGFIKRHKQIVNYFDSLSNDYIF